MTILADLGGWPGALTRLLAGEDLSGAEAGAAIAEILGGEVPPSIIGGFLVALRAKGETVEELAGMVGAMLDAAERVTLPPGCDPVDTCGTGGNELRRVAALNVSTMASLIAAAAGAPVCKHGNRAASSTSGSADVLAELGVAIDLGPDGITRCLAEVGMAFCLAPRFHPAMRHVGPVRRELGVPTAFNVLGPMSSPAGVRRQVLGVSNAALAEKLAGVLLARGAERAMVVHGHSGVDELTTTGPTSVVELRDGALRSYELDATTLGLPLASVDQLRGGDAVTNAGIIRRALGGETGPYRDVFVLNAAAALVVSGLVDDLGAGVEAAGAALADGRAAGLLESLVKVSQAAAAEA
jgi:anthranilate phosphoribosyltransferase